MRILFTRFPLESTLGGAERQTLALMEGLISRGDEIRFAGSCPVLLRECAARGIPEMHTDIGPPPVSAWHALSFAWRAFGMRRMLRTMLAQTGKADMIVMLSLSEKLLLTDIAVSQGIKVFWIEHDPVGRWLTRNPWTSLLKRQSRRATTIVVSELSKRIYADLGWNEQRLVAIPNGVKIEPLAVSHKPLESYPLTAYRLPLRLGCIARLNEEKGVLLLLKAVQAMGHSSLTIVGRGPEEMMIRPAVGTHAFGTIRLLPHVDDLGAFFGEIDAIVLPSRSHDPFGMVAAEAMMAGVPVIVTDMCGIADYLRDGTDAIVVKANSIPALKEGIKRLQTSDMRHQIGEAGRKTAQQRFTTERMVDEYKKAFMIEPSV